MFSSDHNLTANDRYEGFCIDLLKAISDMVGFRYDIHLTPEAKYGIYNHETGEWNGIVRELIDRVPSLTCFSTSHLFIFKGKMKLTFHLLATESGFGHRFHDHQLRKRVGHRFHQTVHESGHQYHV